MKANFGGWIVCLAFWLNTLAWVCAEAPRSAIRISIMADGGLRMNGTAATGAQVRDALEKLSPETGVVRLFGERDVPSPYHESPDLAVILRRGLAMQFAFKPDFSDITANTPAMRIHVDPTGSEPDKVDFTGFVSDICPVHHEKMKIEKIRLFRPLDLGFVRSLKRADINALFPFRGAGIDDFTFYGLTDVYVCPSCLREFVAADKKYTETSHTTGKWTTYVSLRGVPKDLLDAFMAQTRDEGGIADAGEDYAFGCVSSGNEPRRQFVLAGIQGNIGFLIWRQGGFGIVTLAATFAKSKDGWKAEMAPGGEDTGNSGKYFDADVRGAHGPPTKTDYIKAIEEEIARKR